MQNEIKKLKEIFDTNNIPTSIDWLEECSHWCKEQVLSRNYTFDQLRHAVHDQWLLFDLRELAIPLLPPDLSKQKYMVLEGNYSLQLMQVIDISKPKYWQIQQIRKQHVLSRPTKNEMIESTGTGKRVIQLSLTDGVQVIEAMEYEPITCLNINLTPGTKIRLCGPVTIRRGRLMLQQKNIQMIGGEVEDIVIKNAAENVLARILKLPENPNPQRIDGTLLDVNQGKEDGDSNQQQPKTRSEAANNIVHQPIDNQARGNCWNSTTTRNVIQPTLNHPRTNESSRSNYGAGSSIVQTRNNYSRASTIEVERSMPKKNRIPDTQMDDLDDDDIEMLMAAEMDLQKECNTNRMRINKTPDLFDEDFDADQIEDLIEKTNKENNAREKAPLVQNSNQTPQVSTSRSKKCETNNLFDEFINEDDFFGNIDIDSLAASGCKGVLEVISITKLLQNINHVKEGVFRIRAKFKSVAEKLTLRDEEYKLAIVVEDDSNELICQVHNDVISQWAGLTPREISQLKTLIISHNLESKKKVETALQNIKDRLLEIDHQLEIQINGKDKVPIIKSIVY